MVLNHLSRMTFVTYARPARTEVSDSRLAISHSVEPSHLEARHVHDSGAFN
jgi:hypothetical protein